MSTGFQLPSGFQVADGYEELPTLSQHFQCVDGRAPNQAIEDLACAGESIGAKGAATVSGEGPNIYTLIDVRRYTRE
ncbi:MAG: hypothetical protein H6861_00955 [Rhodospirillales bacterium]|nr:hypothetical protein [Rhodospirillales bacterium]